MGTVKGYGELQLHRLGILAGTDREIPQCFRVVGNRLRHDGKSFPPPTAATRSEAGGIPSEAVRKASQEFVYALGCLIVQGQADPAAAPARELHACRQYHRDDAPGGHAVAQQHAPETVTQQIRIDCAALETDADPERHADDHGFPTVQAVSEDDAHALHEQEGR